MLPMGNLTILMSTPLYSFCNLIGHGKLNAPRSLSHRGMKKNVQRNKVTEVVHSWIGFSSEDH